MGWCIWITGLPGSGKSTIARKLKQKLDYLNVKSYIISSDALRKIATPKPKYTEEEREIIYGALVYAAKVLVENGINVIIDATGNRRRYREKARNTINRFMEVYLKCPLSICIERERKRLETYMAPRRIYEKAFTGESKTVPGIGAPYEEPINPEVVIETDRVGPDEAAEIILREIKKRFGISNNEIKK